jgi:hypothetical protein
MAVSRSDLLAKAVPDAAPAGPSIACWGPYESEDAMNWTRVAVTAGLAVVAANLLMKGGRTARATDIDDGLDPFPSVDAGLPQRVGAITAAAPGAEAASGGMGATGRGSDSPNDAERLQASGIAGASDDGGASGDLFTSTSQESPYAKSPGLPDFARGA